VILFSFAEPLPTPHFQNSTLKLRRYWRHGEALEEEKGEVKAEGEARRAASMAALRNGSSTVDGHGDTKKQRSCTMVYRTDAPWYQRVWGSLMSILRFGKVTDECQSSMPDGISVVYTCHCVHVRFGL
jgi:ElaB/YqjD/DUF883 family membrane-anchored ribosome-binding protein